eukprot:CAMPEP_0181327754 /NCGR_PEP_ID=MMETSP1101-20121128/22289_1 /TAXON_ID=46948 /ORGANISM="Rhodomonas abbreviata, Strain Caron Lab Isolate" /LENGTH=330 /DNA_ID=CAMNT_0023436473 /DNA_START=63 /DNA_END=1055 /DNA_ORIENTATION=-
MGSMARTIPIPTAQGNLGARRLVQGVGPSEVLRRPAYRVVQPEVRIGAVQYSSQAQRMWEALRDHCFAQQVRVDFVLFTSYEAQLEALLSDAIDVAWNGPLAHVRTHARTYQSAIPIAMRDVDRDRKSCFAVRADSNIESINDLPGCKLALGSVDSPLAYVLPLHYLESQGMPMASLDVIRFDRDIGKHGDTGAGEAEVLKALLEGRAEAGCLSHSLYTAAVTSGMINNGSSPEIKLLDQAPPPADHFTFDTLNSSEAVENFSQALFCMSSDDPATQPTLQLFGIAEKWEKPRESGYEDLKKALREEGNTPYPPQLHESFNHPFKSLVLA